MVWIGAGENRLEGIHPDLVLRCLVGCLGRYKIEAVFLFDSSRRRDFKATLLAGFNTFGNPIGCFIDVFHVVQRTDIERICQ